MIGPDGEPWSLDTFTAGVQTSGVWSRVHLSHLLLMVRIDAEPYAPDYVAIARLMDRMRARGLAARLGQLASVEYGYMPMEDYADELEGEPLIRVTNIKGGLNIELDDVRYVRKSLRIPGGKRVKAGDVLLVQLGNTTGRVGYVGADLDGLVFPSYCLRVRSARLPGEYLAIFLDSELGQRQLWRLVTFATVRPNTSKPHVQSIVIPFPDQATMTCVTELVAKAAQLRQQARSVYARAEALLVAELGLDDLDLSPQLTYTQNASRAWAAGRLDPEYFQPKHAEVDRAIEQLGHEALGDLAKLTKGTEVGSRAYTDEGVLFVRVSTLTKYGIERRDSDKYISSELYRELEAGFQPRMGEILLSKDGTPGIAYCVSGETECIICGGIVRLEPLGEIDPEYLALIINSLVGQLQIQREATGALIAHWRLDKIRRLKVPLLCQYLQVQIGDLVRSCKESSNEAKRLLGEAKRRVEEMIVAGRNP